MEDNKEQKAQEIVFQASMMKQEADELDQKLEFVDAQLADLEQFNIQLGELEKKPQEFLSNLGKGVFMKTKPLEEKLFVNVGADIIVKKTPKETKTVIESQIKQFKEARLHFINQREIIHHNLMQMIKDIREMKKSENKA